MSDPKIVWFFGLNGKSAGFVGQKSGPNMQSGCIKQKLIDFSG